MLQVIRRVFLALVLVGVSTLLPSVGRAHDASSWGGLFRTRDGGVTWFQASAGKVMGGALAVSIHPTDPARLLLGTDSGLLGSVNGGLDWDLVASDVLVGPVLAVAFDADGRRILAASGSAVGASEDGVSWRLRPSPTGASPVRALLAGSTPAAFFLVGWQGLFYTSDAGATWSQVDAGLPERTVTRLLVGPGVPETLWAVDTGQVWLSRDAGRHWERRQDGLPAGQVQTAGFDPHRPERVLAAGANQVFSTDDSGMTWQTLGRPLAEPNTDIRAIAVDPAGDARRILLSSHRGLYATRDGGNSWDLLADNLPGHIEAGPLVRDPSQSATMYAGFSVTPYDEAWRNAAVGSSMLGRLASSELTGAAAFLVLLGLGSVAGLRWLARRSRQALAEEPAR